LHNHLPVAVWSESVAHGSNIT